MYSQNVFKKLALLVLLVIGPGALKAQNIETVFKGFRSTKGQIVVKVFTDDKSFQDDKPVKTLKYKKAEMVNNEMSVKFDLDAGTYGITLLDDENVDNKMDYSFFGMPEEGFGFSNYYLTGLFRPNFDLFKFTVKKDQKQQVLIRVKYL